MHRIKQIFALISVVVLAAACSQQRDPRIAQIADIVDNEPKRAAQMLHDIDVTTLDEHDRHYRDLLSIKADDKAYVDHTSDSLITDVLGYYNRHTNEPEYPEVLYYAGRVYSDIGDYPTALNYYHSALDANKNNPDTYLELRICSQLSSLLSRLSLYDESIKYSKKAAKRFLELNDTANIISQFDALGEKYLLAEYNDSAMMAFEKALEYCDSSRNTDRDEILLDIAKTELKKGNYTEALDYMRKSGFRGHRNLASRNTMMIWRARIYMANGMADSAIYYARQIIASPSDNNKYIAYEILLNPDLQRPHYDTLYNYILDFYRVLSHRYNMNAAQMAINQQAFYNYQIHQRERQKVEKSRRDIRNMLIAAVAIIVIGTILFLYRRMIYKSRELQSVNKIDSLKNEIARLVAERENPDEVDAHLSPEEIEKIDKLKEEVLKVCEKGYNTIKVKPQLLDSQPYRELREIIQQGRSIKDDSELWKRLEDTTLSVTHDFKRNLVIMTHDRLTREEWQTILLLRFGTPPATIARLCNRVPGTIGSRRESISTKIFDKKIKPKIIDAFIRAL